MLIALSRLFYLAAAGNFVAMIYFIALGFPPEIAGHVLRVKNLRTPFVLFLVFILMGLILHPARKEKIFDWKRKIEEVVSKPCAIWILALLYGLLFLWQQVTIFLAVDVNFLPFSFYDYLLYYLPLGKINYTGLLHTYYHLNNIMVLFQPLWQIVQSPWLLVSTYGFLASFAVIPLYGIAKVRFGGGPAPFFIGLIYLSYRYLQNVLLMSFSVEIFYPLFIFSALYFAMKKKWLIYYLFVLLGLLVKEDSFIYFAALGVLVFFVKERKHGIFTVFFSIVYFAILIKWFVPYTENTILQGDIQNFGKEKASITEILHGFIGNPLVLFQNLFLDANKWRTIFKLLSRLAFVPVFSPVVFFIAAPLLPLFLQAGGADTSNFVDLRFHYAAAVVPFLFISFVFGFSNLCRRLSGKYREIFVWGLFVLLLFLNGGSYVTRKVTKESLQSIAWARSIPQEANLVTHGHLLPYIGYRKYNYFFAAPYEREDHSHHEPFSSADYYLIDLNVNLYPMDEGYFRRKIEALSADSRYELLRADEKRRLFKRKDA